jgi:hypothetical protein
MGEATIELLTAPELHEYEEAPLADKLRLCPAQITDAPLTLTVGRLLTLTVTAALLLQEPLDPITV